MTLSSLGFEPLEVKKSQTVTVHNVMNALMAMTCASSVVSISAAQSESSQPMRWFRIVKEQKSASGTAADRLRVACTDSLLAYLVR